MMSIHNQFMSQNQHYISPNISRCDRYKWAIRIAFSCSRANSIQNYKYVRSTSVSHNATLTYCGGLYSATDGTDGDGRRRTETE